MVKNLRERYRPPTVTFTNTQKFLLYSKKNLGGARVGTYSVISSVMGLEAQKNLGLLM